jgi:hypothetical protein
MTATPNEENVVLHPQRLKIRFSHFLLIFLYINSIAPAAYDHLRMGLLQSLSHTRFGVCKAANRFKKCFGGICKAANRSEKCFEGVCKAANRSEKYFGGVCKAANRSEKYFETVCDIATGIFVVHIRFVGFSF